MYAAKIPCHPGKKSLIDIKCLPAAPPPSALSPRDMGINPKLSTRLPPPAFPLAVEAPNSVDVTCFRLRKEHSPSVGADM